MGAKKIDHIEKYFIRHLLIKPQEGLMFINHDRGAEINLLCCLNQLKIWITYVK